MRPKMIAAETTGPTIGDFPIPIKYYQCSRNFRNKLRLVAITRIDNNNVDASIKIPVIGSG